MPPEAEPVAPASRLTAMASENRIDTSMFSSRLDSTAKPGTALAAEPKPTAKAVFIMAFMELLTPSLMAGNEEILIFSETATLPDAFIHMY